MISQVTGLQLQLFIKLSSVEGIKTSLQVPINRHSSLGLEWLLQRMRLWKTTPSCCQQSHYGCNVSSIDSEVGGIISRPWKKLGKRWSLPLKIRDNYRWNELLKDGFDHQLPSLHGDDVKKWWTLKSIIWLQTKFPISRNLATFESILNNQSTLDCTDDVAGHGSLALILEQDSWTFSMIERLVRWPSIYRRSPYFDRWNSYRRSWSWVEDATI